MDESIAEVLTVPGGNDSGLVFISTALLTCAIILSADKFMLFNQMWRVVGLDLQTLRPVLFRHMASSVYFFVFEVCMVENLDRDYVREIFAGSVYWVAFIAFSILFLYATRVCFLKDSKRRKLVVPFFASPVMASFLGSALFYLLFWPHKDNSATLFYTILRVLALYGTTAVVEILFLILYLRYIQPINKSFAVFLR